MSVYVSCQDISLLIHNHKAFPAGDDGKQIIINIGVKSANDDFIGVVGGNRQLPLQLTVAANHIVAAENLILAVTVKVIRIREMAGVVVGKLPK